MDYISFLAPGRVITAIELIRFPPLPIRFVRLLAADGQSLCLGTEMLTVAERLEVGVLLTFDHEISSGERETFPGGRVGGLDLFTSPDSVEVSGIRVQLDEYPLIVTADAFPLALYVNYREFVRGTPEYALDQYRVQALNRTAL